MDVDVSCSLHLITQSGEIHLVMPSDAEPAEVLSTCTEGMRGGRVTEFSDCLPPGAVKRATIVVNFAQVSVAWVELSTG